MTCGIFYFLIFNHYFLFVLSRRYSHFTFQSFSWFKIFLISHLRELYFYIFLLQSILLFSGETHSWLINGFSFLVSSLFFTWFGVYFKLLILKHPPFVVENFLIYLKSSPACLYFGSGDIWKLMGVLYLWVEHKYEWLACGMMRGTPTSGPGCYFFSSGQSPTGESLGVGFTEMREVWQSHLQVGRWILYFIFLFLSSPLTLFAGITKRGTLLVQNLQRANEYLLSGQWTWRRAV